MGADFSDVRVHDDSAAQGLRGRGWRPRLYLRQPCRHRRRRRRQARPRPRANPHHPAAPGPGRRYRQRRRAQGLRPLRPLRA
ncbi:hypothetical protein [Streptomyces sp. NPDC007355]|uniref:hypothetical protein n=1 Tax=Streptomyces sp. NPDC007355 TaxID=3364778 RepID=UPI0036988265